MSFDWKEYLELAKGLIGLKTNSISKEAYIRCSMSRAYYAVYCKARNYLRDKKKIRIPKKNTHQFVIDKFKNSSCSEWRDIGLNLERLRFDRVQADYEDILQFDLQKQIVFDLIMATQVIEGLRNLK